MASSILHVALFPFMAKGHMIPLLQLVKLIHNHRSNAKFTIFTTLANEPFILSSLSSDSLPLELVDIVSFPFPVTSEIPSGVESTDNLPSMSLFYPFVYALEGLRPQFEIALAGLQSQQHPVTCLVSDGFFYWTQEVASKFDIPRLAFYGMNNYSFVLYTMVDMTRPFLEVESMDELVTIDGSIPWARVTRNDIDSPWCDPVPQGPTVEYIKKCGIATFNSCGLLVNSFEELESQYLDYWNMKFHPKAWCIGPLCLANDSKLGNFEKPNWENWLDKKWVEKKPILYVAFGTQAEVSSDQLVEIMIGLEKSMVDFIWALRIKPNQEELIDGLEERVEGRGLIVRGWVDQRKILEHEATRGYLSHCGWNSVTESICAGVPILAWPMSAEQHLNARLIVEEVKVGLRVETCNGSVRGFVKWEGLRNSILELMVEEKGKMVRNNVEELAKVAKKTIEEGGSSWNSLESLLTKFETIKVSTSD
ncbi:hypothetical protein RND81_10G188300 [Saponaria officinalis]|uniref:Glycosyltransferase n=1 Tax=Saponaria officinalis TaxID=3572 RepID=A0AAW1I6B4_SAPOF